METQVLTARARARVGKGGAQESRGRDSVPAVVYGKGLDSQAIEVDTRDLERVFRTAGVKATVVLKIDGQPDATARIQTVQRQPVSRQVLHVDFYVPTEA